MKREKYVAYVGTYTHGSSLGIHIYDLDVEAGSMKERCVEKINNPSDMVFSKNGKFLYSIADEGVKSFEILPDGNLKPINIASIEGMRGCYLETDSLDKYLFVAGYHDGKVTVLDLAEDGSVGKIRDGVFHKGLGSVAERNFRPHVSCVTLTPDERFLCAVDLGVDHVKIYQFNKDNGKIKLVDFLRCEIESAPRTLVFSKDGKYAYLICELKNYINVYTYTSSKTEKTPKFELIQTIPTADAHCDDGCAAAAIKFSPDNNYVFCSNAGDDSVGIFRINHETGILDKLNILPVSGEYPKDIEFFPDGKHLMSLNHESNTITIFSVDYQKGVLVMKGKPIQIDTPNCVLVTKILE
ncbi:6-phosphogluconolactonase [Lachnotalea glycerini]|jgi:6-phosphogluconolactonase|uniref:6-phosphogluconolactonase n=1 Tax=Lachnotalea glycerini TaxID=1763509 RepID=A0A255IAD5_9FIRM|nr:lactonase family protein [Lachnotalea glycerini]PXV85706.1 6-phosphogluconolactonase [Lachnotalea glycerini]RDY30694.1 lactonase family protein [Lachnotalea glycerini]